MCIQKNAKAEVASHGVAEVTGKSGTGYRRPEIHELGKLEQVQGDIGLWLDSTGHHLFLPSVS